MPVGESVVVEGRRLRLTNLDKVLYPAVGYTKADVLSYLAQVAPVLIRHAANRPVTRKRWPDGTGGEAFFQKNLPHGTPEWVARRDVAHSDHVNAYPVANDLATVLWFGQIGALELHVPQWQFGRTGARLPPDRLVLDLDPGPGAGLAECAQVARLAQPLLRGMGLDPFPVTSGSKGIHLYAALRGGQSAEQVSAVAHELARYLEAEQPDLVVSDMTKTLRRGKVLVDWSQNNGNKTTIAPYSLRGREHPWVAAPRTWAELDDPGLRHLEAAEVIARLADDGDLLAPLTAGHLAALEPTPARMAAFEQLGAGSDAAGSDAAGSDAAGSDADRRLSVYASKRNPDRTPEPMPGAPAAQGHSFVIQEHHARRLHWDFRLERDGVLVSWALPKGEPEDPQRNHLAVQTEDHPLAYGSFEGTIPRGEYGAGTVALWDRGTYETEKWRDGREVIVVLHGERHGTRRLALIHTGRGSEPNNWLIHRMEAPSDGVAPLDVGAESGANPRPRRGSGPPGRADENAPARSPAGSAFSWRPMLPTSATRPDFADGDGWAVEMKWDGFRALARVDGGRVRLVSRSGKDLADTFPELQELADAVDAADQPATFDGEIVALGAGGRPSFRRLQQRANLTRPGDVAAARARVAVDYMAFDVVEVRGRSVMDRAYDERRALLDRVLRPAGRVHVPPVFEHDVAAAIETSRRLGMEGIVAKRRDSPYLPGRRSRSWVKLKHVRAQEVVVVGWRPGHGGRGNLLGSLLLAVPDGGGLRYVGRVGSGFTDAERRGLPGELAPAPSALEPAAGAATGTAAGRPLLRGVPDEDASDAHWVLPDRVAEVTYTDWTATETEGPAKLRHAVWRGWRPDKAPSDVVVEA